VSAYTEKTYGAQVAHEKCIFLGREGSEIFLHQKYKRRGMGCWLGLFWKLFYITLAASL